MHQSPAVSLLVFCNNTKTIKAAPTCTVSTKEEQIISPQRYDVDVPEHSIMVLIGIPKPL